MKRRGLIAVLSMLMIILSTAMCFAEDDSAFALKSSYPRDGQNNTSIENLGVKLHFNHSVSSKSAQVNNAKSVKIVDKDGKKIPIKVLTANDKSGLVLVLGDSTNKKFKVKNNSEYKLIISEDFVDDSGNTLGKETVVSFRTFNQTLNTTINMVMMVIMFGGIMVVTIRQQHNQKNEEKVEKEKAGEATFNPYKEAKRTGKSVEEVIAEEKKRVAKAEKRAKRKGTHKEEEKLEISELLPNVYKVHKPSPIKNNKQGQGKSSNKTKNHK